MINIFLITTLLFCLLALSAMASKDDKSVGSPSQNQNHLNGNGNSSESKSGFVLRSPEVTDGEILPKDYTGDGSSATLPLEWDGVPEGTKSFAVIMHHIPGPGTVKWYWVLYNIPADVRSLPKNVKDVGTLGNNSVNERMEYAPPHSKGPGPKTYIYTVYALSAAPQLNVAPDKVSRKVLLAGMKGKILATGELHVVYSRPDGSSSETDDCRPPSPPPPPDKPDDQHEK